jgi:hypothetical protein
MASGDEANMSLNILYNDQDREHDYRAPDPEVCNTHEGRPQPVLIEKKL